MIATLREQEFDFISNSKTVTSSKTAPSSSCRVCHRPLKNLKSIVEGVGPICRKKHFNLSDSNDDQSMGPWGGTVRCKRIDGQPCTNVPRVMTYHSPNGFEWGYGGSGPADFALNILLNFTDKQTAFVLHQKFKWDFIAKLPWEGGTIEGNQIIEWIEKNKG